MDRINNKSDLIGNIVEWIKNYAIKANINSLVVGVSGGIDSAVVSTLCAKTNLPVYAVNMPIKQHKGQEDLADIHLKWLESNFDNVHALKIDLTDTFISTLNIFDSIFKPTDGPGVNLTEANTRSRLRMVTLYYLAGIHSGLVVGTGNKVEDFGVGFYTKYGDGGVDISPIADLYKTEVRELGKTMGVDYRIVEATPTDGLWDDARTDEDQLGMTYEQLESLMHKIETEGVSNLSVKESLLYIKYEDIRSKNLHKMNPIPVFKLSEEFLVLDSQPTPR